MDSIADREHWPSTKLLLSPRDIPLAAQGKTFADAAASQKGNADG